MKDKAMNITFDKKVITAALGITAKELQYLTKEFIVPVGEFGEYDIGQCITDYSKYLSSRAKSTLIGGELVNIDEIIFDMKDKIARFRTRMLEIPERVVGLCGRLKDARAIERFMHELIEEALTELTPLDCTKYLR